MSEETTTTESTETKVNAQSEHYKQSPAAKIWPHLPATIDIERNGVTLTFEIKKPARIKDATKTPLPYYSPTVEGGMLKTVVTWFGLDNLVTMIQGKLNAVCQGWMREHISENGMKFDKEGFIKSAQDLSVRGISLSDLHEMQAKITEDMVKLTTEPGDMQMADVLKKLTEYGEQLKEINLQISSRKRSK